MAFLHVSKQKNGKYLLRSGGTSNPRGICSREWGIESGETQFRRTTDLSP